MHTKAPKTEALTYSLKEFCQAVGITSRHFYNLRREGKAPPIVRLGRRKIAIRLEAARRWLKELERHE